MLEKTGLAHPHNLPEPLTSFIGRQHQIAEVKRQLGESRLLTLTGAGGCGKTRLALQTAQDALPTNPDGVWLIELASLTEPELLPQAVATALQVREGSGQTLQGALIHQLRPLNLLLVLDNCEHLIQACARLCQKLLQSCPDLQILATSREPLGVPGELLFVVPPLSIPEPQPWRSPSSESQALAAYQEAEAVRLFIDRAASASPGFQLNAENAPWVADICRRLDGIPLAIELAAARLRTFSPRQIAAHLDDRFGLLTSRLHTAPPRHQTLEAMLDWSYHLLEPSEQVLLQQLSVFASGWTLEAVEELSQGQGQVLQNLSNLVDKSLVLVDRRTSSHRYHFLETIRQYAHNKLQESGNVESARDRHLAYYLKWAEQSSAQLVGREQVTWLERFDKEHDNLRVALAWSQTTPERQALGLRLSAACGHFWRLRGYLTEGREHLAKALSLPGAASLVEARAWVLLWSANLAYLQSDYQASRTLAQQGLDLSRQIGQPGQLGVARGLDLLGELATEEGDYSNVRELFGEALTIYRQLGDRRGIADMLMQLGWAAMREGDYPRARNFLNECLSMFRELGESATLGLILSGLGELAIRQKRLDQAKEYLEESLSLRNQLGERWGIAASLGSLGWLALQQQEFDRMRSLLAESLFIRQEINEPGGMAWCLEKLAEGMVVEAQPLPPAARRTVLLKAVEILGFAQSLRAPLHSVVDPADLPAFEQRISALHSSLENQAFDYAWAQGSQKRIEEIIALAVQPVLPPAAHGDLSARRALKQQSGGLSPRERETALLVARGKTNREIAEILVVREKTIETYITRILNKLGFNSRVQIATWVFETGLADLDSPSK